MSDALCLLSSCIVLAACALGYVLRGFVEQDRARALAFLTREARDYTAWTSEMGEGFGREDVRGELH